MKRIATILSIMATSIMLATMPVSATEPGNEESGQPEQQWQKDECLLYAQNCENNTDTVEQRIDRLNREISKGTTVYTNEELGKLNEQLDELIDVLMKDRPSS